MKFGPAQLLDFSWDGPSTRVFFSFFSLLSSSPYSCLPFTFSFKKTDVSFPSFFLFFCHFALFLFLGCQLTRPLTHSRISGHLCCSSRWLTRVRGRIRCTVVGVCLPRAAALRFFYRSSSPTSLPVHSPHSPSSRLPYSFDSFLFCFLFHWPVLTLSLSPSLADELEAEKAQENSTMTEEEPTVAQSEKRGH